MARIFALTAMLVVVTAVQIQAAENNGENQQIAKKFVAKVRELRSQGELKGCDIEVQVSDAVVWVSGKVPSTSSRRQVLDIACRIPGVKQVVNDLQLSEKANAKPTDTDNSIDIYPSYPVPFTPPTHPWPNYGVAKAAPESVVGLIVQSVKGQHAAGKLKGYDLSIELYDGIAVLRGSVADERSKRMVIAATRARGEVAYVCHAISIAEAGTELPNKATTLVAGLDKLELPKGAKWLANNQPKKVQLNWSDGYWQLLDFNSDTE